MADGKKNKRSLREAFGMVRPPEQSAPKDAAAEESAGPVGAPEGGEKPPARADEVGKPAARKQGRASSSRSGAKGGTHGRRTKGSNDEGTGDPVNTGNGAAKRGGGRGRAAPKDDAPEMVPGKGGKMVAADTPVNMTFTVTAKERYLWTLELKRRGLTAVGVLRETMEAMVGDEGAGGR